MANTSVEFFPRHLFDNFSLKGAGAKGIFGFPSWLQELLWANKLRGLPHPGSTHTWTPRWH